MKQESIEILNKEEERNALEHARIQRRFQRQARNRTHIEQVLKKLYDEKWFRLRLQWRFRGHLDEVIKAVKRWEHARHFNGAFFEALLNPRNYSASEPNQECAICGRDAGDYSRLILTTQDGFSMTIHAGCGLGGDEFHDITTFCGEIPFFLNHPKSKKKKNDDKTKHAGRWE